MPAPTTTYRDCEGMVTYRPCGNAISKSYQRENSSLVIRRLRALEHRRLPVCADRCRALHPRAELRLRELRVLLLEPDPVRVAGLEMLDQHLARELVLPPFRDREVDLEERVRVAVEDRRDTVLDEQLDVLEPVDVAARRRRLEIDVLDLGHVLLIRETVPREVLGVDPIRLIRFMDAHSALTSSRSGRKSTGYSRCFWSIPLI